MVSTTTNDVCTVDHVGSYFPAAVAGTGADALALVAERTALLTGGPRVAPIPVGAGGEVRPQRVHRSAERGGRGTRIRRTTPLLIDLVPATGAPTGSPRHLRSCGTPVPGSAPSDTAP